MASDHTPCGCRDCMDVTVSSDVDNPDLCEECEDAGCARHGDLPAFMSAYGVGFECQRVDVV